MITLGYFALQEDRYDNLYLDTTVVPSLYFRRPGGPVAL